MRNVGEVSLPNIVEASLANTFSHLNFTYNKTFRNIKLRFDIFYNCRAQHPTLLTPNSSLLTYFLFDMLIF